MLSRRSMFSVFAGLGAAIAAFPGHVRAEARAIEKLADCKRPKFLARGTIVSFGLDTPGCIGGGGSISLISDGVKLIPLVEDEGQRILNESAVNLKPDGTINHRPYHWPWR